MSEGCGQILHSFFVIEWKRRKGTDVEKVTGYVEHIVFRNEENGYTVFHLENEDGEVTCVGNLNFITEGEMLELEGEYVNHSVYGNQLKVSAYRVKEPEDLVSIERYLGSGAIKGIGQTMASRIVKKFREDTFRIIEEEPERLAEIKGISERKAMEIASQMEEKKDMRKSMIYLQKYGISTKLAAKIYQRYGMKVHQILEENPYRLADDIAAPLHELGELFLRRGGEIEPFALDLLVEELVKLGLVVKEVPEFLVVHPRDDVVGNAARDLRSALRVV